LPLVKSSPPDKYLKPPLTKQHVAYLLIAVILYQQTDLFTFSLS